MAQLDNQDFAADLQPLLTGLIMNPNDGPTQSAFVTALVVLLNQWATATALGPQISGLVTQVQTLLTQFMALVIKGVVANVAALPGTPEAGAVAGAVYLLDDTGHGYAYINGLWEDLGPFRVSSKDVLQPGLANLSPAGSAALNQRILQRTWFGEG